MIDDSSIVSKGGILSITSGNPNLGKKFRRFLSINTALSMSSIPLSLHCPCQQYAAPNWNKASALSGYISNSFSKYNISCLSNLGPLRP